jgi:hypothetical protein
MKKYLTWKNKIDNHSYQYFNTIDMSDTPTIPTIPILKPKNKARKKSVSNDAPAKKPKSTYVKPSSLIKEDALLKQYFEIIENRSKDDIIILQGKVIRVYTDYGGAVVLEVPLDAVKTLFWPDIQLDTIFEKTDVYNFPWTIVGDNAHLKLGPASKCKFTFEQMFRALQDENHAYGYGKEGSMIEVYVHANTYKDLPKPGVLGVSLKLVSPVVVLPEGLSLLEFFGPESPEGKPYDFESCLREAREQLVGKEAAEIHEATSKCYPIHPNDYPYDADLDFYCE